MSELKDIMEEYIPDFGSEEPGDIKDIVNHMYIYIQMQSRAIEVLTNGLDSVLAELKMTTVEVPSTEAQVVFHKMMDEEAAEVDKVDF